MGDGGVEHPLPGCPLPAAAAPTGPLPTPTCRSGLPRCSSDSASSVLPRSTLSNKKSSSCQAMAQADAVFGYP
jgi:hypothetical protein